MCLSLGSALPSHVIKKRLHSQWDSILWYLVWSSFQTVKWNSYMHSITKDDGKIWSFHSITPESVWLFLWYIIFTRLRSNRKWSIVSISRLELLNLDFPTLIDSKIGYAVLWGKTDPHTFISFPLMQCCKPVAIPSVCPRQMFRWLVPLVQTFTI